MDEMKQDSEIDNALRELANVRDRQLGATPLLSPERRAVLTGFLAVKFSIESALREAATRRDRSLNPNPPKISMFVESALHRQLLAAETARDRARNWAAAGWGANPSIWRRIFRSPLGAGLTACAVITAAIVCFERSGPPPRRSAGENLLPTTGVNFEPAAALDRPLNSRAELFSRRITLGPFNLNTREPASLEASFASNRRIQFADGIETPLGLRLDLPVRATLLDDGLTRTP